MGEQLSKRRDVLKGLFAGAVTIALPKELLAAPGYEKAPLLDVDLAFFKKIINDSTALKKFQDEPHWRDVLSMIRVLARTDAAWVHEQSEDEARRGEKMLFDSSGIFTGNATVLKVQDESRKTRYVLATARHVVEAGAVAPHNRKWKQHPYYDLALCEISEQEATRKGRAEPNAIDFGSVGINPEDCAGKIGVVDGKNERNGVTTDKPYPSLISPLLSHAIVFDALKTSKTTSDNKPTPLHGEELRMIVIPPGEATLGQNNDAPARGKSGTALKYRTASGTVACGGIISTTVEYSFGKETYTTAYIIDQSVIRDAIIDLFATNTGAS
jgi:hypothetical protein